MQEVKQERGTQTLSLQRPTMVHPEGRTLPTLPTPVEQRRGTTLPQLFKRAHSASLLHKSQIVARILEHSGLWSKG